MTTAPSESAPKRWIVPLIAAGGFVLLVLAGLASHYSYSAHEGFRGFGEGTSSLAQSETYKKYFADARQALEAWLQKQEFQSTPVLNPAGAVRYGAIHDAWYVGRYQDSRPFTVKLHFGGPASVGLGAGVDWTWQGLKWGMKQDREKARAFDDLLQKWWNDYTRDHPLP